MSRAARALLVALLAASCGGHPPNAAGSEGLPRPALEAAAGDACPADEALLGSTCWSAAGTRWRVAAQGPGESYEFELTLLRAGRVRSTDHAAAGPASDEWFQQGELLRVFLGDRFVEYRARIGNGTVLTGEALNVRGQRWSWRADRDFEQTVCARSEALVDDACLTVEGTRWRLEHEATHETLEFLAGGALGRGAGDPDATRVGTWSQTAEDVRFAFGSDETTFLARLENADQMTGSASSERGAHPFVAVRMPSLPPP